MKANKYIGLAALLVVIISFAAGGCDSTGPVRPAKSTVAGARVSVGGTVVFRESGSGFYGILADNGRQYEPANLDTRFRSDGMRISFTGMLDTTTLGEHHWGNPIELASVSEVR
jgi:hypothetical protein